jgi:cell division septation protein DedD
VKPIYLQVGAFAEEVQARSLAQRLLKLDFPVVIQPPSKDRLHRVRVGPFASAELADAAQKRLEAQGFRQILRR